MSLYNYVIILHQSSVGHLPMSNDLVVYLIVKQRIWTVWK